MEPTTGRDAGAKVVVDPPGTSHVDATGRVTMSRRVAPAVGLFLLAPLVAEYLLGNFPIGKIPALVVLAPMYGGGALLIREVARRTGRGWPTIVLLALAYGVLEPGLLDNSMFNPAFQGHDFRDATWIPVLGISAGNTLAFTVGHAIWSISIPIALVETFVPYRRTTPWLGKIGLSATGVLFLFGCVAVFRWAQKAEQFLPSVPQMIATAAVVVALIVAAFAVGRIPLPGVDRRAPNPWFVGVLAFVASSLFFARSESWPGVAFGVSLIVAMTGLIVRWSSCEGWGVAHRLALAGGALMTYAWGGFVLSALILGRTDAVDLIGNALFALGALALLYAATRTVHKTKGSK
ncbi:MAG TPA: hypothetical protein VHM69_15760 [Rubrobacter sp.]|nr:hypothetical protein [Rubrobacter sp.]